MTQSEIEYLKDHIDRQFGSVKERYNELTEHITKLQDSIPQIAREQAQTEIAKTSFITPTTRWTAIGVCATILALLFGIYGKQTTALTQFHDMRDGMSKYNVIENAFWVGENKKKIIKEFEDLRKNDDRLELKMEKIKGILTNFKNQNRANGELRIIR